MTVVLGNWEDEGEDNLSTGVPNQSGHDSETPFQKQTVTIYLLCIKHVQGKKNTQEIRLLPSRNLRL